MLLNGIGIGGFRSFHGPVQWLAPLAKINLVAGQNNSGKSNVLRAVRHLDELRQHAPSGLDVPRGVGATTFELFLALPDSFETETLRWVSDNSQPSTQHLETVQSVLSSVEMRPRGGSQIWLAFKDEGAGRMSLDEQAGRLWDSASVDNGLVSNFALNRLGGSSSARGRNELALLRHFENSLELPRVRVVEASRRITGSEPDDDAAKPINGSGLIKRLLALQSPPMDRDSDRVRFKAINEFLQSVLDEADAQIEISFDASEINVRRGGRLLPLESLGTGVSQVIILAAAATLEERTVVCMEEPEVHLHPLLQRKLLRYLHDRTDNQYIIATHSAHMLDSSIANVFHATYTASSGTELVNAGNAHALAGVCADLGYRPSDLLQSNATLWVEGPSDRIYLRHWISLVDPSLREGIDYTIMFYGGRLLSHLTADDPELDDFISLRRLNRHLLVMIDSDKKSAQSRINETKRRVRDELEKEGQPGLVWITSGRTVENYVPPELLVKVLSQKFASHNLNSNDDKWSDVLKPVDPKKAGPDKVKLAKYVVEEWKSGLKVLDLRSAIIDIVNMIRNANGAVPIQGSTIPNVEPVWYSED